MFFSFFSIHTFRYYGKWKKIYWNKIPSLDRVGGKKSVTNFCVQLFSIAIVKPLKYPMTITKKVVAIMILNTWISPALLSFIPIFAGWYTTPEHKQRMIDNPDECQFEVNTVYAVISSSISFWIPCTIMIFTYLAIFREANRQEKQLAARQGNAMLMHRHSSAGGTNGKHQNYQNQC